MPCSFAPASEATLGFVTGWRLGHVAEPANAEAEELIPVGDDRVIVYLRVVGVGRDGIETVAHVANITTLRSGRVSYVRVFHQGRGAVEAAGLSEQPVTEEGVDLTLRQIDAVNRRDAEAFVATLSAEVEWEDALYWSDDSRVYRGRAEVREWFNEAVVEPWKPSNADRGDRRSCG